MTCIYGGYINLCEQTLTDRLPPHRVNFRKSFEGDRPPCIRMAKEQEHRSILEVLF